MNLLCDTEAGYNEQTGKTAHCLIEKEVLLPSGKKSVIYGVSSLTSGKMESRTTAMISFNKEIAEDVVVFLQENCVFSSHVPAVVHDLQNFWIASVEGGRKDWNGMG